MDVNKIQKASKDIRLNILKMINKGASSHIGSAFSCLDIICSIYYNFLKVDPKKPADPNRDLFILSKGHAGAAIYATLSHVGFFPEEDLLSHYQNGSIFSGHVSHKVPGVDFSTGSLGHGLSVGVGAALSIKKNCSRRKVCVLMSDGECDEGAVWEAAMFASHHKLSNLYLIIDYNKIQSLDSISNTLELEPLNKKWSAFGWNVVEVDGHNHKNISSCLNKSLTSKKPTCLIAHTTKGKGVSFMENSVLWHYRTPVGEEFDLAKKELGE